MILAKSLKDAKIAIKTRQIRLLHERITFL